MSLNPLWDLIQNYMDQPMHRYRPVAADLARETGVSDQVISKWKSKPMLPSAEQLSKFSAGTGIPYVALLEAALRGKGYLPQSDNVGMTVQGPGVETLAWMRSMEGHDELFPPWRVIGRELGEVDDRDQQDFEELGRGEVRAQQQRRARKSGPTKKAADSDSA